MRVIVILILLIFVATLFFAIGYVARMRKEPSALTPAEKRLVVHHLTKDAERVRVDSQALQQVGFDQPAIIDRASDLEALAEKINNL